MYFKFFLLFFSCSCIINAQELITPIPDTNEYHQKKALLGKKLFFEPRLSADNTISCAHCHDLNNGGDDNLAVSFGINGKKGIRNSPTVLNAKFNTSQFWDGRAKDLKEQVEGPIHNPVEMGSNFSDILLKLNQDANYKKDFSLLYEDGITKENIIDSLVEFENALTTPNSRFDQYLQGNKKALNKNETNGYFLFKEYGCIACHNGVNIGGNLLQRIGVVENFDTKDFGLFNVTKKEEDKFYFKVPSLRNVALTAPYFHHGEIDTLAEAVDKMIKFQVGFMIKKTDRNDIIAFLMTLTGETPEILKEQK
jgi:cytochrome c peroxidase